MAQMQRYSIQIAISIRKISSRVEMRITAHTALVGENVWVVHSPITVSFPWRQGGNLTHPEERYTALVITTAYVLWALKVGAPKDAEGREVMPDIDAFVNVGMIR